MPNSYFRFKEFTVHQDRTAMKVCTDACLFGAIVAGNPSCPDGHQPVHCLDIGAGTGLLSLLYAQINPHAIIDAVELDPEAAQQATENFKASPWHERLKLARENILDFSPGKKYGLIFSNPPFFEDDLRSGDARKNQAKHDTGLSLADLARRAGELIDVNGVLAVLLPHQRVDYFVEEAGKQGFHLAKKIGVKQTTAHGYFRGILFFVRTETSPETSIISIKDDQGNYTSAFVSLLKPYYLYL